MLLLKECSMPFYDRSYSNSKIQEVLFVATLSFTLFAIFRELCLQGLWKVFKVVDVLCLTEIHKQGHALVTMHIDRAG